MQPNFNRAYVLKIVLIMEFALLIVAGIWAYFARIDVLSTLKVSSPLLALEGLGLGLGTSSISLGITLFTKRLSKQFPKFVSLDDFVNKVLYPIFAEANMLDVFLIATASGICEEIFFRGVLQQQFGLIIASLVFGLFHPGGKFWIYTAWAILAGFVLGLSFEYSHCLWVPIAAHFTNNFLSLLMVRYRIGYDKHVL